MFENMFRGIKNIYRKIRININTKWNKQYTKLPSNVHYFEGSLYDAIYDSALKNQYNTAIEFGGIQISYKDLIRKINKVAKSLKALGVKKGDIVTICMPNTPEEVSMFYAINEIGAIANMVHPLSSEKELLYYLNKSNSKVMLCIDVVYPKLKNIINDTKLEKVIITSATKSMQWIVSFIYWLFKGRKIGIKETDKITLWKHFIKLGNKYKESVYDSGDSKDPAVILYSGGTTGKPKGVVISNYSFNAQALQSRYVSDVLVPGNSFLTFLPNFHAFGLGICTHTPLYNGMKVILIPKFESKKLKKYIKRYKFNVLCGVPSLYDYMSKLKFRNNDLKCLKLVVCGGDSISLSTKKRVNEFLKKYGCTTDLRVGYGLTESSGVICLSPEKIYDEANVIGYPFPNTKFKIMDIDSDKECLIGDKGEICISGPNIMKEYLAEKEETKKVLFKDKKGNLWLHTGDIGYIDQDGLIHYESRLKRMIITNGYNVYPSQVEEIIASSEYVLQCAVVGIKNPEHGETIRAYIVLKNNGLKDTIKAKVSIQKLLKENLAKYEQPREFRYLDELPVTLMGKVDFKELENME